MVEHLPCIVEYAAIGSGAYDVLNVFLLIFRSFAQVREVVDIGLQVFSVMEFNGFGTDDRFQPIGGIGEAGHFVFHDAMFLVVRALLFPFGNQDHTKLRISAG